MAIVTGVSRRQGIGFALAERLLADGFKVVTQSWKAHDRALPWGKAEPTTGPCPENSCTPHELDLTTPGAPQQLLDLAMEQHGRVDVLVCCHARHFVASLQSLEELTEAELDLSFAVNCRSTIQLVKAFSLAHVDTDTGGRIVLLLSNQHLEPMTDAIPYALSKGALHQIVPTVAHHLARRGITVNGVNPGPTDTGWAPEEVLGRGKQKFPRNRWGQPSDAARLISWLVGPEAGWVTGQIINSEGGFTRYS